MEFRIDVVGGKAAVYTPYYPDFIDKIKRKTGKWDAGQGAWIIEASAIDAVRKAMREEYGRDDQSVGETVRVRLTFLDSWYEDKGPVALLGRILSRAYSRDGGGKAGEGVIYINGRPSSGGSKNNWRSIVPKGSVIELPNIPKALVEGYEIEGVEIEIMPETFIDVEALRAERERCAARIAEIDAMLNDAVPNGENAE